MTRTLAVATAALVLALVAARPAHAQAPGTIGVSAPADPDAPPPVLDHYIAVGGGVGAYNQLLLAGAQVDAGLRIPGSPIWLHGTVGAGSAAWLFDSGNGSFSRATAGFEAHGCLLRNTFCVFGGADLGIFHAAYTGTDSYSSGGMDVVDSSRLVAVPRAGFDVGSQTMRFRWTLDVPLDLGGADPSGGAVVAIAVAHRW